MRIVKNRNDVLTVLIHLGYLAYDGDTNECYIPNKEVADEFLNAVEDTSWTRLVDAITASQKLPCGHQLRQGAEAAYLQDRKISW